MIRQKDYDRILRHRNEKGIPAGQVIADALDALEKIEPRDPQWKP